MNGESSQAGAFTSYTTSGCCSPGADFLGGSGPKSYWMTSLEDEIDERPPQPASPSAMNAMYTEGCRTALAPSILEPRLSRARPAALRAEEEGLRVLVESVERAVERPRVALQLLDQRIDPRQGLVVERTRRRAELFHARCHAVEGGRALLELAREPADVGKGAARVSDERRDAVGARLKPLGQNGRLARRLLDPRERPADQPAVVLVEQV